MENQKESMLIRPSGTPKTNTKKNFCSKSLPTMGASQSVQQGGQNQKIKIAPVQGTPWGLLELESNGSNVFQEVFHVDQGV